MTSHEHVILTDQDFAERSNDFEARRIKTEAVLEVSPEGVLAVPILSRFVRDERGVTSIEYALIASLIAIFIIVAVQLVGTQVSTVFTEVGNALK